MVVDRTSEINADDLANDWVVRLYDGAQIRSDVDNETIHTSVVWVPSELFHFILEL